MPPRMGAPEQTQELRKRIVAMRFAGQTLQQIGDACARRGAHRYRHEIRSTLRLTVATAALG